MNQGRRDQAKQLLRKRCQKWTGVLLCLVKRRTQVRRNLRLRRARTRVLELAAEPFAYHTREIKIHVRRVREISMNTWEYLLYGSTDLEWQTNFRINKRELGTLVEVVGWPTDRTSTKRNGYSTCPTLSTLILLRRLASPCRWLDLVYVFFKHPSQLCEIFWESLVRFWRRHGHILTGDMSIQFIASNADRYSNAINQKCAALENCIGFIDGTVLGIARPGDHAEQHAAYNGHKRKHALKFQTITTPDGLIIHAHGPMAGSRHDWALYVDANTDEQLQNVCRVGEVQYYIHGDSGYNRRCYLDVPFCGANITPAQRAANRSTSAVRVTVEWMYKEIKLYWTTTDFKRKMRTRENAVALLYLASMLLTNVRTCLYHENTVSQYFKCRPPTLQLYLEHKEE